MNPASGRQNISSQDKELEELKQSVTGSRSNTPMQIKQYESESARNIDDQFRYIFGEQTYMTFGLESGYINGHTTFRIAFDNPYAVGGHGESELRWPLNNSLIGLGTSFNYRLNKNVDDMRDRARLDFIWLTRMDKNSGRMRDSDWIENDLGFIDYYDNNGVGGLDGSSAWATDHAGKDIYSETVANVDDLNIFDVNYTYNFWPHSNWAIGPRLGYRYQEFDFSAHSLEQTGYGPYGDPLFENDYIDTQNLKWGTYEAKYYIPYIGLSSQFLWQEKFYLFFNFGFSDWVKIKDKDTHLYPTNPLGKNMVSKGTTKGWAHLYNIQSGWRLSKNWLFSLGATYVEQDAKGDIVEYIYYNGVLNGYTDPIGHKVTSKYWLIDLSLKYRF